MREGLKSIISTPSCSRITPARAGRAHPLKPYQALHRDHPRSRGKDSPSIENNIPTSGSPPLAREGLCRICILFYDIGITPARAGRTFVYRQPTLQNEDHPRLRGKDKTSFANVVKWLGSPPLAREGQPAPVLKFTLGGITPARAGRTTC